MAPLCLFFCLPLGYCTSFWPNYFSLTDPLNHRLNHCIDHCINHCINQPLHKPLHQSNRCINHSSINHCIDCIDHCIKQLLHRPSHQPSHQSNQRLHQPSHLNNTTAVFVSHHFSIYTYTEIGHQGCSFRFVKAWFLGGVILY